MARPIIINAGATFEYALIIAGNTGWFPHYLPIAGSAAIEVTLVMGTAFVLHEVVELGCEIADVLEAWQRSRRPRAVRGGKDRACGVPDAGAVMEDGVDHDDPR